MFRLAVKGTCALFALLCKNWSVVVAKAKLIPKVTLLYLCSNSWISKLRWVILMLPHTWWGTEGTGQQMWSTLCRSVNVIQELRLTCQLNIMKIILEWKVVSTWNRSATFWKLPCLHHHSVMMQVSKTLGCCSELMQLVARGDQHCKNGSFSYSLLWYDYSVKRKQVSGIQLGKVYRNFNSHIIILIIFFSSLC